MLANVGKDPKFPRTLGPDGKVKTVKAEDWTSGFFPGTLWLLHEYDPAGGWKDIAWEYTRRLEVIRHFKGNHDGGFMLGCSYGNALRLDPSDESRARVARCRRGFGDALRSEARHDPFMGPQALCVPGDHRQHDESRTA